MATDKTRRERLEALREKLKRGETVQNRTLETWLDEDIYAEYLHDCTEQRRLRKDAKDKPFEVTVYEKKLTKALLAHNKADAFVRKGKFSAATKARYHSQALFEKALEYLNEQITMYPYLQEWFDRSTYIAPDSEISLEPASMPRVVTSRSIHNNGGGILWHKASRGELKLNAVQTALDRLDEKDGVDVNARRLAELKAKLRR